MKLVAIFLVLLLAGCGGTDKATWKEEVLLHDGKKIVVKMEATRGSNGFPDSHRGSYRRYQIRFSSPDVTWKTEGYSGAIPVAVEVKDGIPYVIVLLYGCGPCSSFGYPYPSLGIWKWDGKQGWYQGEYADLPANVRMNIISDPWDQTHRDKPNDLLGVRRDLNGFYSLQRKTSDICYATTGCSEGFGQLLSEYVKYDPARRSPGAFCTVRCKRND